MRVVCVKWGDKYDAEWVYRLRDMVERNLQFDEFICMTDDPIPDVDCIDCAPGLPEWWAKVGLFRPGLLPGLNLYLDLDVVITAPIDDLVRINDRPGKVVARDDFSYSLLFPRPHIPPDTLRQLGGLGTVNSSVMIWRDDAGLDVWEKFDPACMRVLHGDQNWITQALWPHKLGLIGNEWICSYKYHVLRGEPPAPIVVFHGTPKVDDLLPSNPLRQIWERP